MFHIALFEPDIPQNTGAVMRIASCFNLSLEIIEPCGFVFSDSAIRKTALDYCDNVSYNLHENWQAFQTWRKNENNRLILFSTKADSCYDEFQYQAGDVLLFGRESSGVPDFVHRESEAIVKIPIHKNARSLNLAMAVAIGASHARLQLGLT